MPDLILPDVDAVVVGAGFAGLRSIHALRQLGLTMQVFEAGTDVGGTWYWNRYPGARTDTESWAYCFSFDRELWEEWAFRERFTAQPDVLAYLRRVADKHDMRKHIRFSSRVDRAVFDEETNLWAVHTADGAELTCRWLITGLGWFGIAYRPPFPGADSFQGESYVTSRWPHEPVDFAGKRVALSPEQLAGLRRNYDDVWEKTFNHVFAFPMEPAAHHGADLSDEELDRVFEAGWEAGGFRYIFETVDDMLTDQRVNDAAAEFVRRKIAAIVKDPATAELLCPKTHPIGGKRPPLGNFYYEAYNRPNVTLVSVRDDPIREITPTGLRTGSQEYEFDVIVYATGFDAITGPLAQMNVHGLGGRTIAEEWKHGAKMLFGLAAPDFPNLFSILGPQAPFASHPPVIETQVQFIEGVLARAFARGATRVEATPEATQAWSDLCDAILKVTLLEQGLDDRPWFLGANVPGKDPSTLCYLGGMAGFITATKQEVEADFPGFSFAGQPVLA